MRLRRHAIVGLALLVGSVTAHAVPVSFEFVAAPGTFGSSGPGEELPPAPPASLDDLVRQPIVGSFTFETLSPSTPGYLPYEGQLVEVGASYINPVLNFDLQLGTQALSFISGQSSITVVDLPSELTALPGDFYRLSVLMGTGLISGFESYRVSASLSLTESDRTRIVGYDPLQPLLLTDASWNLSFSLFDLVTEISYDLYTPVTQLQQLVPTQVPEPSTSALLGFGLLLCFTRARRHRRVSR